jgi:DNA helicase HerA-like ATPase
MRSQLSFVEERVRGEMLRRAVPVEGHPGAVGFMPGPVAGAPESRAPRLPNELGTPVFHDLSGLVDWLVELLSDDELLRSGEARPWVGNAAAGTVMAFTRRLESAAGRLRGLVRSDAEAIPRGDAAQSEPPVAVVHLTRLHEFAQRFVVGTLLAQTFAAKESGTRDPIEFVVLDELNKYAPREGASPIKDTLIDIAQRGRSLGVILVGAQQQASLVAPEVTQNAAVRISGRLDPAEAERAEYGWLSPAARARARLLMQGRVMVSQPSVPAPLTLEIPFPPWATAIGEAADPRSEEDAVAMFR